MWLSLWTTPRKGNPCWGNAATGKNPRKLRDGKRGGKCIAELLHFRVGSDGHAQHLVQRRKGSSYRYALCPHLATKRAHITADIDHDEIGMRLNVLNFLLP